VHRRVDVNVPWTPVTGWAKLAPRMSTFCPQIRKGPRSDRDPTPVYFVEIAEIVNGEEPFKSLGIGGEPMTFRTVDELLDGLGDRLARFFKPFEDLILWDHQEHGDIASAMVHVGANPLAQQEELEGKQ
jgi:hypothetical protein